VTALDPGDSPGFLLWHATLRWQRAIAAALAPLGLTHVQFVLLASTWWLNRGGEDPSQIELAGYAGTDVKMTSQVLRSLERKGLIAREVDRDDARARRLRVTPAGARLAPRAIAEVEAVDAQFFAEVPRSQALGLLRVLAGPDQPPTPPSSGSTPASRSSRKRLRSSPPP
jgi:DNA-binding MarR family transcriptional regulator